MCENKRVKSNACAKAQNETQNKNGKIATCKCDTCKTFGRGETCKRKKEIKRNKNLKPSNNFSILEKRENI